jgi:hypothetical protein
MSNAPKSRAQLIAEHQARLRAEMEAELSNLFPAHRSKYKPDFTKVWLGTNADDERIWLDEVARLEHMQAIGVTGSGKSNFLEHIAVQDIQRGRGLILLDPHGNHPDSVFARMTRWIASTPLANTSRIHIVSPNEAGSVVGFNPLAKLPDTSLSVIADALLQAFERAWGDENTQEKPTIRSVLKATFIALAELDLTLCEAKYLYDQTDVGHRVREKVLAQLTDEYARDEIARLHETAKSERSKRDFRAEVVGPINRINEFVSSEAIRAMVGQTAADPEHPGKTLDLMRILNRADILLVNLQHGPRVSEADTNLLGAILLRYIFLLAARRTNREPFFLYVDECHRYLTGDVPNLLAECRKMGIGSVLSHQYMAQLGEPTDLIYQALRNSTRIKAVFNIESAQEAQDLAELVLPINLEVPVAASIRPVQVGYRIDTLNSAQVAEHDADSYGVSESAGESIGEGVSSGVSSSTALNKGSALGSTIGTATGRTRANALGSSAAEMSSSAQGNATSTGHADSVGISASPTTQIDPTLASIPFLTQGGPIMPSGFAASPEPWVQGVSLGQSDSSMTSTSASTARGTALGTSSTSSEGISTSDSRASSTSLTESTTHGQTESRATSQSTSRSVARGTSTAHMRGQSTSEGRAEALFPVYENLPTSFHSKDNMVYVAGEVLRTLPKGTAVIRAHGVTHRVRVPLSKIAKGPAAR